jgi:hypothetical protein
MQSLQLPYSSPQRNAVSYGNTPQLSMEPFIESQAELLPQMEELRARKEYQDAQLRLAQQERQDARRDANVAMGIKGVETGVNLATNPTLQKYGAKVWNALKPKPPTPVIEQLIPGVNDTRLATNTARGVVSDVGGWTEGIGRSVSTESPSLLTRATDFKGILPRFGGEGIAAGAGNLAMQAIPGAVNYGLERAIIGKKATGSEQAVSDVATSFSSFMLGGPIGLGLNLGKIGFREFAKKNCIIVETCYGHDSDETNLAREYRNKYFSKEILRGYYAFSEPIVELMEQYPEVKAYYRKSLVEPLLRVAKWKLGYTKEHPTITDCAIAANHTNLWHDLGASIKSFTRNTGEVV